MGPPFLTCKLTLAALKKLLSPLKIIVFCNLCLNDTLSGLEIFGPLLLRLLFDGGFKNPGHDF
jgi:hypothetical protein